MSFADHKVLKWPITKEGWCDYWKELDKKYDTDKLSPLHHDNRCAIHAKRPR